MCRWSASRASRADPRIERRGRRERAAIDEPGVEYEYVVSYRFDVSDRTHAYLLRKPANTSGAFSYWGELANRSGVAPLLAAGSAQDLEVFMFSQ